MVKELTIHEEDIDISTIIQPLFMLVMLMAVSSMMVNITPMAASAQQYYSAQSYIGLTDDRVLNSTSTLQWLNLITNPPYHPWITAYFFNDGPQSVFIGINNPDELYQLASGEDKAVNFTGANRRIELVFYKSNLGEKASVRVVGKY